jgi:2-dehydropantoate 2-reductase
MRICVFGAGAVGGHLAARLSAAGHEISAVARGANLEAIRARGIVLHSGEQTIAARVRACASAEECGPQDAVLVTAKATALHAFAAAAAPLAGPGTIFVFAQNGIPWWYAQGLSPSRPKPPDLSRLDPGGALARALAPESVVGAVIYSSNDLGEPGVIHNYTPGQNMLVLGAPDDRQRPRIDELRAALASSGMHSPPTADIRASVWHKLLSNLGSALCVAIGEPLRALHEDPQLRETRERLMAEGRAIARAHGVSVDDAPLRPGGPRLPAVAAHKPSMLQDYELGRPMEVEAMLATPRAFARAAGVATPTLDTVAAIVQRLAAGKGLYAP